MKHISILLLLIGVMLYSHNARADLFGEVGIHVRSQVGALDDEDTTVNGVSVTYKLMRKYDVNYTKNPYCSIAIGYRWYMQHNLELSFALCHESSIATGQDKGINEAGLTLRWGNR